MISRFKKLLSKYRKFLFGNYRGHVLSTTICGEIEKLEIKGVSLQEGFQDADCVLIMNNHRSYGDIDILGLLQRMKKPALLFDGWHLFPLKEIERIDGISYEGLSGRN